MTGVPSAAAVSLHCFRSFSFVGYCRLTRSQPWLHRWTSVALGPALLQQSAAALNLYVGGVRPGLLQAWLLSLHIRRRCSARIAAAVAASLYVGGVWPALLRPWRCPVQFWRCLARVVAALAASLYACRRCFARVAAAALAASLSLNVSLTPFGRAGQRGGASQKRKHRYTRSVLHSPFGYR